MLRSTLTFKVGDAHIETWASALAAHLPDWEIVPWQTLTEDTPCHYAAVWKPEPGRLAALPGLRGVVSLSAGVDHLLNDPKLPPVPIVRLTGEALITRMTEHVTLHTLRLHRRLDVVESNQRINQWRPFTEPLASERRVGVLGYGALGRAVAIALARTGFSVGAWARRARHCDPEVDFFHGDNGLAQLLARTEILICLLPLTNATENILNRDLFDQLPPGACVINVARGEHLVEADLIQALDAGQLRAAALDVFRTEPLPTDHPFWQDPRIMVTPHVASLIDASTGAPLVAAHLERFINNKPLVNRVDTQQGY